MNSLTITKGFLRIALGAAVLLYCIFILCNILSNGAGVFSGYLLVYCLFFVQTPAILILIISSIYNYIINRRVWAILKTEYYLFFSNIASMLLLMLSFVICPKCSF